MKSSKPKFYKYLKDKIDIRKFLDSYDHIICDCDGVFWRGNLTFKNVKETLEALTNNPMNKTLFFVTNNSTSSREMYVRKFREKVGIEMPIESMFPSSYLLAQYLKSINFSKKAYVCGMEGIKKELDLHGIRSCGYGEHNNMPFDEQQFVDNFELDEEIGAIVGSYDKNICNFKIAYAHGHFVNNKDCLFLATNRDATFPMITKTGKKVIVPGGGTYVSCLTTCFQKEPFVVGKPSTFGLDLILKRNEGMKKEKVCYIGDRLDTDILMANNAGVDSVLVLTGVSKLEELEDPNLGKMYRPSFVIDKFSVDYYCDFF